MTRDDYQEARKILGLSINQWVDRLGISESAHKKYSSGNREIPLYIQRHIETLLKYN
jgi:predicted transcriptional regulator